MGSNFKSIGSHMTEDPKLEAVYTFRHIYYINRYIKLALLTDFIIRLFLIQYIVDL